jgi:rare lipoprotein A
MVTSKRLRPGLLPIFFVSILFAAFCAELNTPATSPMTMESRQIETGNASWYGLALHRRHTANGERFDMHALTAAHRTLPFGTVVRVTDLTSRKFVHVRINDRGPMRRDRIIDLSYEAAKKLGITARGTARVKVTVVDNG